MEAAGRGRLGAASSSASGGDVHDLRGVIADLVGELGVDVHYLVVETLDAGGDQDVVKDLGDAVEIVGVLLIGGQRRDQVGQDRRTGAVRGPGLENAQGRAELVVVQVADHHD